MTYRRFFRQFLVSLVLTWVGSGPLTADVMLRSEVLFPVADSAGWFAPGLGLGLEVSQPTAWTGWSLQAGAGTQVIPTQAPTEVLAAFFRTGVTWEYRFASDWAFGMHTSGGLFTAVRSDLAAREAMALIAAGASVRWSLEPAFSVRAGIEYLWTEGLYQVAALWLGLDLTEVSP